MPTDPAVWTPSSFLRTIFAPVLKSSRYRLCVFALRPEQKPVIRWPYLPHLQGNGIDKLCGDLSNTGHEVYFGLGLLPHEPTSGRGLAEDVAVVTCAWADIDYAAPYKTKTDKRYAPSAEWIQQALADLEHPPSLVTATGGGCHAYWLYREPVLISDETTRRLAESLSYGVQCMVEGELGKHGYALDHVADLSRILRVAGTVNHPAAATVTVVHYDPACLYEHADLPQIEPPQLGSSRPASSSSGVKVTPAAPEVIRTFEERITDLSRVSSIVAPIWHGEHNGKSDSETDYQLACEALSRGWNYEDTRGLLLALRSKHGRKLKADSYYDRTVNKARESLSTRLPEVTPGELADLASVAVKTSVATAVIPIRPTATAPRTPDRVYNRTDTGNAKLMCDMFEDQIIFLHDTKTWCIWGGHLWEYDDKERMRTLCTLASEERISYAPMIVDEKERLSEIAFAKRLESKSGKDAALTELSALPGVAATSEEMDTENYLIGAENTIVNIRTREEVAGHADQRISMCVNTYYQPEFERPHWDKFMLEICSGDACLVDYLQCAVGYALTATMEEQLIFFLEGAGANGKSTFLEIIKDVLGDYGDVMDFKTLMPQPVNIIPQDIAGLRGKRFVFAEEPKPKSPIDEGRVKLLTGGTTIKARKMRENDIRFRPKFTLFIALNNMPNVRDFSFGFRRRVKRIPFRRKFTAGAGLNRKIGDTLRTEFPGIFNWIVEGAHKWAQSGLPRCAAVEEFTSEFFEELDPFPRFIRECCIIDPALTCKAGLLRAAYEEWFQFVDIEGDMLTGVAFFRRLQSQFESYKSGGYKVYRGVGLKGDSYDGA